MPAFGPASLAQLATCDERLKRVFTRVVQAWDCTVIEGKRSEAQQDVNVTTGTSRTHDSKHVYPIGAPSLAVDVAPYPVNWHDLPRFYAFAGFVIGTAREMGITLRWGGDWSNDRNDIGHQAWDDLPHFEIAGG